MRFNRFCLLICQVHLVLLIWLSSNLNMWCKCYKEWNYCFFMSGALLLTIICWRNHCFIIHRKSAFLLHFKCFLTHNFLLIVVFHSWISIYTQQTIAKFTLYAYFIHSNQMMRIPWTMKQRLSFVTIQGCLGLKRAMAGGYVGQHYFPRCAWWCGLLNVVASYAALSHLGPFLTLACTAFFILVVPVGESAAGEHANFWWCDESA
jgi:hypothetical protein